MKGKDKIYLHDDRDHETFYYIFFNNVCDHDQYLTFHLLRKYKSKIVKIYILTTMKKNVLLQKSHSASLIQFK